MSSPSVQVEYKTSKLQSPSRLAIVSSRTRSLKVFFSFHCSSPPQSSCLQLPNLEGKEDDTADYQLETKAQLSVIDLCNPTLPIPVASGYPLAIPTHLAAGNSICYEQI